MSSIDFRRSVIVFQKTIGITASLIKSAGSMLTSAKDLSIKAKSLYDNIDQSIANPATTLRSGIAVRQDAINLQQKVLATGQEQGLSTQETIKVAALASANLYVADRSQVIQQAMQILSSNPTLAALETFTRKLETAHQPLVSQSLSLISQQASIAIGFANIQTNTTKNGVNRVIASDDCGRTLVTEIVTAPDGETTIATEVIGMSDPSCGQILDEFNKALEEAGVRSSPPDRKSTGGVCVTEAAKEFISRQPLKPKTATTNKSKASIQPRQVAKRQQHQQF